MPDLTLNLLGEQAKQLIDKVDRMHDDITVLTGMTMRVAAALQGLVTEMRGLHREQTRLGRADATLDERVTDVEARAATLEEQLTPG